MMPRETVSRYFPLILLICLFLLSADLKIVQNKNKSSRSAELANFFNMKNSTLQTFKIITQKSLLMDVSFLLEVISRSQLPQRFYIFVLGEGCSKTGMKVTGISLCVLF